MMEGLSDFFLHSKISDAVSDFSDVVLEGAGMISDALPDNVPDDAFFGYGEQLGQIKDLSDYEEMAEVAIQDPRLQDVVDDVFGIDRDPDDGFDFDEGDIDDIEAIQEGLEPDFIDLDDDMSQEDKDHFIEDQEAFEKEVGGDEAWWEEKTDLEPDSMDSSGDMSQEAKDNFVEAQDAFEKEHGGDETWWEEKPIDQPEPPEKTFA